MSALNDSTFQYRRAEGAVMTPNQMLNFGRKFE